MARFSVLNIGLNIAGILLNRKNVAFFVEDNEVLTNLTVLDCKVDDNSKLPEHPLEDGVIISDHKIFMPREINIKVALPTYLYKTVYNELNNLYRESTFLIIKTKAMTYSNMQIESIPHFENVDNIDRLIFDISFKECVLVSPTFVKLKANNVSNKTSASKKELGQKSTKANTTLLLDTFGGFL